MANGDDGPGLLLLRCGERPGLQRVDLLAHRIGGFGQGLDIVDALAVVGLQGFKFRLAPGIVGLKIGKVLALVIAKLASPGGLDLCPCHVLRGVAHLDPGPAFVLQSLGGGLDLVFEQALQQSGIIEPGRGGEEIAGHRAAGLLIGLGADEAGHGRIARLAAAKHGIPHVKGGHSAGRVLAQGFEYFELAFGRGGQGEGLGGFQSDLAGPESGQDRLRQAAQRNALAHQPHRPGEASGDRLFAGPGQGQAVEAHGLVGRRQGLALDIEAQGNGLRRIVIAGDDIQIDRSLGGPPALGAELGQGPEAAGTVKDLETLAHGADGQRIGEALGIDHRLEAVDRSGGGARIDGRVQHQPGQGCGGRGDGRVGVGQRQDGVHGCSAPRRA